MSTLYGAALLTAIPLALLFYSPYITDLAAGAMEGMAGLFRRHATAMRAAYTAYTLSWKSHELQ